MPVYSSPELAALTSYTLSELVSRVRRDCRLVGSDAVDDQTLVDWANEGNDELARRTYYYRETYTFGASAGVYQYSLPDRLIMLEEVRYDGTQLTPLRVETLRRDLFNYQDAKGTPTAFYIHGGTSLGFYPTPASGSADNVTLVFAATPTPLTLAQPEAKFTMIPGFERGLIVYVKRMLAENDLPSNAAATRYPNYAREWEEILVRAHHHVRSLQERATFAWGQDSLISDRLHRPRIQGVDF